GHAAGLVVMATGLGKTWVAAFDTARPSFRRVLFVAHRDEILRQSRDVFRAVQPDADLGLFTGTEKHPAARAVFASVQTPARHLAAFDPDALTGAVATRTRAQQALDEWRRHGGGGPTLGFCSRCAMPTSWRASSKRRPSAHGRCTRAPGAPLAGRRSMTLRLGSIDVV